MLSEERHKIILDELNTKHSVTVQELMEILSSSESTIRRDLVELDSQGLLTKVHGGAVSKESKVNTRDFSVFARKEINVDEKEYIAEYAASLIEDNDFVYLDAGTTTELLIKYIKAKNAVFVTNAFLHAKKLSEAGFLTYILGGEIKLPTEAVVGEEALISLSKYHFTKGFWGANGISPNNGFSTPDIKEALIKKASMEHTQKCYILSDSSKFSQTSSVAFADFTDATIITTKLLDSGYRRFKNIIEVENI